MPRKPLLVASLLVAGWAAQAAAAVPPAPTLIAPVGTIFTPKPTHSWTASSGATSYNLSVFNSSGTRITFLILSATSVCAGSTCAYTPGASRALGDYTWRVMAKNASGGTDSILASFTVAVPPPPVALAPNGFVTTPTPTYTWNASTGATGYRLQVLDSSQIQVFVVDYTAAAVCSGTSCAATPGTALLVGAYTWHVRGLAASGGGGWSATKYFEVQGPPAPTALAPSGSVTIPTPTYSWNTSTGATNYQLQVLDSSQAQVFFITYTASAVCSGSSCAVTPAKALAIGSYTWHVRGTHATGAGSWSTLKYFSLDGPPAPVAVGPTGAVTTPTPTYTWNTSTSATGYQLQVLDSSEAQVFFLTYTASAVCSGSSCAVTPANALTIGSYTWHVRGTHATGAGAWSAAKAFSVQGPDAPVPSAPNGMQLDPTPTFTWSATTGATSYDLQVLDEGGTSIYLVQYAPTACSGSLCTATPTETLPIRGYSWHVRGNGAAGAGAWSAALWFSVEGPPAPVPHAPTGTIAASQPTYSWDAAAGATHYALEVLDDVGVRVLFLTYDAASVCAGNACAATPSHDLQGDYSWHVRGQHVGGPGAWSTALYFHAESPNWAGHGCGGGFASGDFNGDGLTDRLCSMRGVTYVSLSTPTGLASGTAWLIHEFTRPVAADFNGDGKADVAEFDVVSGEYRIAFAQASGDGFAALASWGTAQVPIDGGTFLCKGGNAYVGTGDFDGDGAADVYCRKADDGRVVVGRNTRTAFSFSLFGDLYCDETKETVGASDLDGDGRSDWYCISYHGRFFAQLSNGTSFVNGTFTGIGPGYCDYNAFQLMDLNADGAPDIVCPRNGNVALSTGRSFIDQGSFGDFCTEVAAETNVVPADVDGDGIAEIVCNRGLNGDPQARDLMFRRWTGTQLLAPQLLASYFCADVLGAGDFDGDGRNDLVCGMDKVGIIGTSALVPDLMLTAGNGLGGTTRIGYTPSSRFPTANNPPVRLLVTSVTTEDGRGSSSTSTYSYSGAMMHRTEGFLGFEWTLATRPCLAGESACPTDRTWYSREVPSAGKVTLTERRDGAGALLRSIAYGYLNSAGVPRTSVLSEVQSTSYDAEGGLLQTKTQYSYDNYGNVASITTLGGVNTADDELQTDTAYACNTGAYIVGLPGRVVQHVPDGGRLTETRYLYDGSADWTIPPSRGALTGVSRWLDRGDRFVTRTMSYDDTGKRSATTDETSRRIELIQYDSTYDLFPVRIEDAAGDSTRLTWDASCGTVTTTTDPNQQQATQEYDALCRPTITRGPGQVLLATRSYLGLGVADDQRSRVETPAPPGASGPLWSEDWFDGLGRTWKRTQSGPAPGQDIVLDRSYNARGGTAAAEETHYSGETARTTQYEYDALDRVTRVLLPGQREVSTDYGVASQTVTDPDGKQTTTRFDAYGRPVEVERSLSGQPVMTQTRYDSLGHRKGMTDPIGAIWTWEYDSLGRGWDERDPDAGHWVYGYDDAGRPTSQTDAKGQQTTFEYDSAGRLWRKANAAGTVTYSYSETRSGYFNQGRLTTATSPADVLKTDHDAFGRLVRQDRLLEGSHFVVHRNFDAGGYLLATTYPDQDVVGPLAYDGAGRLSSIPGIVTAMTYDAGGRPLTRANANPTQTTWTYDATRGFLERIYTSGPAPVQDLRYTMYTDAGLLKQVTSIAPGGSWSYEYDGLNHLAKATNADPAQSQDFTYDAGDRIQSNSRVGTYDYPVSGEPGPRHAPTTVDGASYLYDANGNLISGGGRSPVWNANNLIAQIGSTQFSYDGFGERVKTSSGSTTSLYPFGDDYEVTNGVVTKYISVDGLGVIAKRVGYGPAATTYWVHTDRLGSIDEVTDGIGAIVLERSYRPYGETLSESGNQTESRGWIDQRNDSTTGLTYLHARYFDPKLGTFLSPDPIGVAGGMNLYGYGFGDPVNGTDRSGLLLDQCEGDPECRIRLIAPGVDGQASNPGGPGVSFFATGPGTAAAGAGVGLVAYFFDKIAGLFGSHNNSAPRDPSVPPSTAYVRGRPIDPYSDYEEPGPDDLVPLVPSGGTSSGGSSTGVAPPPVAPPPGGGGGGSGRAHPTPVSSPVEFRYNGLQWPPWGLEVTDPALEASLGDPDNWKLGMVPIGPRTALNLRPAYLYSLWQRLPNGSRFLKWGISVNPFGRYGAGFMRGKFLRIEASGGRGGILELERRLAETRPGPLNREPWAGSRLGMDP